jgi:pyruvate kinase
LRKTKIIATLGPKTQKKSIVQTLITEGLDVVRENFSHGTHEEHGKRIDLVKSLSDDVAIMLDTKGPEIRTGMLTSSIRVKKGMDVYFTTQKNYEQNNSDNKILIPVTENRFFEILQVDDGILLDDGAIKFRVTAVNQQVEATVLNGGIVKSRKAVNVPNRALHLSNPTKKDIEDIKYGIKKEVDYIAASFIEHPKQIKRIRSILQKHNSQAKIIAKIESSTGVENLDEIINVSDGIMVARGDLGVEIAASTVPVTQKSIIKKCNNVGSPVIIATQMLKSMTQHLQPTRAEASDVANAVFDGADALMLSEETAIGSFPVDSFRFMVEVISNVEKAQENFVHHTTKRKSRGITDVICKNVWQVCQELDVDYILAHTSSGSTALNIAKYRPTKPILTFTDSQVIKRQLRLIWGVKPYYIPFKPHFHDLIKDTTSSLKNSGNVTDDSLLVITAGVPNSVSGITNLMEIRRVKEIIGDSRIKKRD